MLPSLPIDDFVNRLFFNVILACQFCPLLTLRMTAANLKNLAFSQFGFGLILASRSCRMIGPAFPVHILHVFGTCSKPHVIWIRTTAIIACVTSLETVGNRAFMQFITKAMGFNSGLCSVHSTPARHEAVTTSVNSSRPIPTTCLFIFADSAEKIFFATLLGCFLFVSIIYERFGLPFHMTKAFVGFWRDWSFLTTTAMAVTVGNIVRGIIGVHKNLQFLCQAQDAANVAGQLYWFELLHFSTGERIMQRITEQDAIDAGWQKAGQ